MQVQQGKSFVFPSHLVMTGTVYEDADPDPITAPAGANHLLSQRRGTERARCPSNVTSDRD